MGWNLHVVTFCHKNGKSWGVKDPQNLTRSYLNVKISFILTLNKDLLVTKLRCTQITSVCHCCLWKHIVKFTTIANLFVFPHNTIFLQQLKWICSRIQHLQSLKIEYTVSEFMGMVIVTSTSSYKKQHQTMPINLSLN